MREHPLLMKGPLVRATLAGLKTQTRRPVKCGCNHLHKDGNPVKLFGDWSLSVPPHQYAGGDLYYWRGKRPELGDWIETVQTDVDDCLTSRVPCTLGQAGDRLWVRETWQHYQNSGQRAADFSEHQRFAANCFYRADESNPRTKPLSGKWRPSLLMPRWACRLVLPLVSVRVERVQDITEEDAKAEGVERISAGPGWECWMGYGPSSSCKTARDSFRSLWISIYGQDSWDANPWVWVAEWREIEARK